MSFKVASILVVLLIQWSESSKLPEPGTCGVDFSDRIYGGTVTKPKAYPWTAILVFRYGTYKDLYWCGGSLISDRYVLTAAHCVDGLNDNYVLERIRLGEWDLLSEEDCDDVQDCNDPPQDFEVEEIISHENFTMDTVLSDIALIKLNQSVTFTEFISPVCLPIADPVKALDTDGFTYTAVGWGNTEHDNNTSIQYGNRYKLHVQLHAINSTYCNEKYNDEIIDSQLCAGAEAGKDTCQGDSGGGLINTVDGYSYAYGVVSYGKGCGQEGTPGVYTRVTSFLDWIDEHMDECVWSPHNRSTEILTKAELAERSRDQQQQQHRSTSNPDPPPQPVWTPRSAPPSPVAERREFRPIGFESPTPQRRNQCATPTTPAPWTTSPSYEKPVEFSSKPAHVNQATSRPEPTSGATEQRAVGRALQNSNSLPTIGHSVRFAPQQQQQQQSRQQAVQSPTINTLLKNKDGKIGQQVSTFESASNQSNVYQTSTSQRTTTNQQTSYQRTSSGTRLGGRTSEISQPVGRQVDYLSEPESMVDHHHYHQQQQQQRSTPTMAQLSPRKVDGVGPTTREGMPLTLRSEVDENNQAKWYKKMYQTLHKAHDDDDFVTVRYKTRRGNFPYKSSGGYQSEPEPNYDSDYTIKYSTLDRRRTPTALNPNSYSRFNTLQGSAIKSGSTQYRNQPGRIENYTPGRSSISEKESKEWWDEVMDIFNGQIEQQKLSNSKTYTEGNLSRALKQEQGGYDSDSTLIFRKKEPPASSALSPIEQKQYYKNMQAGGEIPVQGFRKPAPEKPKEFSNVPPPPPMKGTSLLPNSSSPYSKSSNEPESPRRYIESDVNIHYKTPIRYEYKEAIPDDELAYRQAEHMRRVYQEERRRKYMHELEDLQNRRHTDNFVPSQKSPIPVNRYEDFDADLAPKPNNVLPRTIARALYNFQGQTARELSFKKGDIIYLRRQIDKNWYEGEHNAMIGLLPANYIEILPRDGAKPLPKKPQREGKARAKFNFTAQTSVELSLLKGELVTLTRRVDDNWFEGRIGNKKGIFPVSYVEVLTDIGGEESYEIEPIVKPNLQTIQTHTLTTGYDNGLSNGRVSPGIIRETKTVQKTEVLHVDTTNEPISYRALYNYKPQNSDELELLEGDVVYVLEKCDDGWYVGTSARTGCFGTFPGNYVKKL